MKSRRLASLVLLTVLSLSAGRVAQAADTPGKPPQTLGEALDWLQGRARQMVRDCRVPMRDGKAAFPPQVGAGYDAFWLRDYAYMLEGASECFSDQELKDALRLFIHAQRADGACVDCVKFDGHPIYKPGFDSLGANPVADGSQFTVDVAWYTYARTKDAALVREVIDALLRAMQAVPRDPENGLVYIKPGEVWDRCPYGFTDTVHKEGDELFCSLLYIQAARQLADLLEAAGRTAEAPAWRAEAERLAASVRRVFWDASQGLFLAATVTCRQPDLWGSAFAVYLDVATPEQASAIARYFQSHYGEILQCGQLRHLPGGMYWEKAGPKDEYQNGGYWATPIGWFVYTLDRVDPVLADRTMIELVRDFQRRGVTEWVLGDHTAVPDYLASATLPLAGARKMMERRAANR